MKIAVTGATGFVGTRLVERLVEEGHSVVALTRSKTHGDRVFPKSAFPNVDVVEYSPLESGEWQQALSGCDGVVNLAGAGIADERWTPERKQEILDSRKVGTEKIVEAIAQANPKPSVLVNSSAIGYYGTSETATFDESSAPGDDFLAQVCQAWEAAAESAQSNGTRVVILRTGIVLGMGGALGKMLTPFRLFAGGPLGTGRQWFSWIHRDDLVNLILKALTDASLSGTYNATAPNPVRMAEFCQTLGQVMGRPSWLPVPAFALEALLGDAAQVVLEGQQVLPKRTQESGFAYQYPEVKAAIANILQQG
ncbi:TIGR01777 family oxidoreductase [Thermoleptolyngbya sp. C42_A2020_037]|uniref:thylakoid membrane protein ThyD n=1 Tax=Thermoleptolyngbya sp. C42_A2020_037 TaxID=2747799 RepID=UPI0019D9D984|nr:TIGR01777 family oxidoreductase [Thermoleptolyngbya sp. C42_A2020_037]MBF2084552.1 TIGR01777 family protein [Thermoleptolyngbya sp. C42_A2020_037]